MVNIFILILMSSLFTGLVMLIFCASDKKFGAKLLSKRRSLAATVMLALQPLMIAVATALSFAHDIFGTAKEVAEDVATEIIDTVATDTAAMQVTATEATATVDSTVGVTVSYAPDFGTILNILALLWLAGIAVTALYKIVSYLRFVHNLRKSLTKCDYDVPVPVFTSPEASSPFLMGFFRSKIILPDKPMEREELELAIRHELIHHRRHDIQKKFFAEMLKCVNWFNPAFYVFANKLSELSELTVDEILSSDLDYTGRKAYGGLLLKFASSQQESILCTDLSKAARSLAERLELIMENEKRKTTKGEKIALGILSAVTLAVIGVSVGFCMTAVPTVMTGLEIDSGSSDDVIKIDLSNQYFIDAPTVIEDGPENPLLDADFTGCSVYVERWVYGFFDEPALLDDDSAKNIVSIIESMELDRLPSEVNVEVVSTGSSTASLYTIVMADGTEHGIGEISTYYNISPTEEVNYSCLIIDGYFYIMSDEGSKLLSEFRQSWLEQYLHDTAVNGISYNEYKYNLVHSIGEWEYERNIQDLINGGIIESEEEYYEILAGIDDITKYVVSLS
ncbi:MAG: M56 family metallopeptidase [Oscillospiraceae bacterium]|nr:M56 family metallopeptidase [Oscillospiraceae bacterium]